MLKGCDLAEGGGAEMSRLNSALQRTLAASRRVAAERQGSYADR